MFNILTATISSIRPSTSAKPLQPSIFITSFLLFPPSSVSLSLSFLSRSLSPTTGVLRASNQSASERLLFLERLQPSGREMERWREGGRKSTSGEKEIKVKIKKEQWRESERERMIITREREGFKWGEDGRWDVKDKEEMGEMEARRWEKRGMEGQNETVKKRDGGDGVRIKWREKRGKQSGEVVSQPMRNRELSESGRLGNEPLSIPQCLACRRGNSWRGQPFH